jgi:hypothetical protein
MDPVRLTASLLIAFDGLRLPNAPAKDPDLRRDNSSC